jgi:hypothetical protein
MNWIELTWLAGLTICLIVEQWRLNQKLRAAERLISEETKRKVAHTKAFERLTDPEAIVDDFEASAIQNAKALEALQANRTTEVRDDAGPHAVVHRVRKMRPKIPSLWNPPADYSDRVREATERRNRGQ